MQGDGALSDGESDAGTFRRDVLRVEAPRAIERLEDTREVRFLHTRSVIANGDPNLFGVCRETHFDRQALVAVNERVAHDVVDGGVEDVRVAAQSDVLLARKTQPTRRALTLE